MLVAMEKSGEWEVERLINELRQGETWAKELQTQLKSPYSQEHIAILGQKIYDSLGKTLSMLNYNDPHGQQQGSGFNGCQGSPPSASDERREVCKKRKSALPMWTEKIRVCPSSGMESPQDDGYSWRKYGQKDILGSKYPRGYFRCTHKNAQGCQATKQVQRSDKDPTIFEVTYRGYHTCIQAVHALRPAASSPEQQADRKQVLISFGAGLKVKMENSDVTHKISSPPTSFPSTSMDSAKHDSRIFSAPNTEDPFLGSFHFSPATSESNYFSLSPTSTSVTNTSPFPDMDFSHDSVLDTNFSFDEADFFSGVENLLCSKYVNPFTNS